MLSGHQPLSASLTRASSPRLAIAAIIKGDEQSGPFNCGRRCLCGQAVGSPCKQLVHWPRTVSRGGHFAATTVRRSRVSHLQTAGHDRRNRIRSSLQDRYIRRLSPSSALYAWFICTVPLNGVIDLASGAPASKDKSTASKLGHKLRHYRHHRMQQN